MFSETDWVYWWWHSKTYWNISLIFSRKQVLTFHANWRQFAWNVKTCFLGKIRKLSPVCLCRKSPKTGNGNLGHSSSLCLEYNSSGLGTFCNQKVLIFLSVWDKCLIRRVCNSKIVIQCLLVKKHFEFCYEHHKLVTEIYFSKSHFTVIIFTMLQLGFEGRGVPSRALFAWSYKNENTMCYVMC